MWETLDYTIPKNYWDTESHFLQENQNPFFFFFQGLHSPWVAQIAQDSPLLQLALPSPSTTCGLHPQATYTGFQKQALNVGLLDKYGMLTYKDQQFDVTRFDMDVIVNNDILFLEAGNQPAFK